MKSFTVHLSKTFTPRWIKHAFTKFDESYRGIRGSLKYQGFSCFKCHEKFAEGESIALVALGEVGNKVFCEVCATELETPTK